MTPAILDIRDENGIHQDVIDGIYFDYLPRIYEFIHHKERRLKIIGIEHRLDDETQSLIIIYCQITNEKPEESSVAY